MSTHNKVFHIVKIGVILIFIGTAFYIGIKTSEFIDDVQAKKALIDTVADGN